MKLEELKTFAAPFYEHKDIMHNIWHIELVEKWVNRIIKAGHYDVDVEALIYALYFHGFIYSNEDAIHNWLASYEIPNAEKIIKIAWESQRPEKPETLEGKILHDAHVLEGGKTYMVVKTLITGSVRGQSLLQTLQYLKDNVVDANKCYLPETIALCNEMNDYAKQFIKDLEAGLFI